MWIFVEAWRNHWKSDSLHDIIHEYCQTRVRDRYPCNIGPHPRDSSLTSFSSIVRVQLPGDQLFVYRFGTGIGMEVLKLLILTMANIHWCFHRLLAECKALLPEILIPSPWPIGYSNAIYMDNLKNFVKSRIYKCIECKNLRFASFLGFKINKWILGFMVEISIRQISMFLQFGFCSLDPSKKTYHAAIFLTLWQSWQKHSTYSPWWVFWKEN